MVLGFRTRPCDQHATAFWDCSKGLCITVSPTNPKTSIPWVCSQDTVSSRMGREVDQIQKRKTRLHRRKESSLKRCPRKDAVFSVASTSVSQTWLHLRISWSAFKENPIRLVFIEITVTTNKQFWHSQSGAQTPLLWRRVLWLPEFGLGSTLKAC